MCRKMMSGVLAIGIALIVAPFAIGLPGKSADGEQMIQAFAPIMEEGNVQTTVDYYYDVFVPLGGVVPAMSQENIDTFNAYLDGFGGLSADAELLVPALAAATGMTPEQAGAYVADEFPAMAQMLQALPQVQEDFTNLLGLMQANVTIFEQVPGGLDHYEPLVTTMQEQRENYESVASLPDFRAFTWMFVVPGALLVVLALFGLFRPGSGRNDRDRTHTRTTTDTAPTTTDDASTREPVTH
jgi:hypothetical protein